MKDFCVKECPPGYIKEENSNFICIKLTYNFSSDKGVIILLCFFVLIFIILIGILLKNNIYTFLKIPNELKDKNYQ